MIRKCWKCKTVKPFQEFGKRKEDKDGIDKICKICRRERDRDYERRNREKRVERHAQWRDENRDSINEKNRSKYAENNDEYLKEQKFYRPRYKDKINVWYSKYNADNRIKLNAQEMVRYYVKKAKLIKPENCSLCERSGIKIDAHHEDYSKPLDIVWLCCNCHLAIHRHRKRMSQHPERLNEKTAKADAKVCSRYERSRGRSEEVSPPSQDGQ